MQQLVQLLEQLPDQLAIQVFRHASWTKNRSDSYARLAFLGDSVLELAVGSYLYPRLHAEEFGAGRLSKIRGQAVSGRSCRMVAERMGVPDRLRHAAPAESRRRVAELVEAQRVLASIIEAIIGACFLHFGYEKTAQAVVEAFQPEIEEAMSNPVDFKSALQERLGRTADLLRYETIREDGPQHAKQFQIRAVLDQQPIGEGVGQSKKEAEQLAAHDALQNYVSQ